MRTYCDAEWSYASPDYPPDLSPECAATCLGVFLTWAIQRGLASSMHSDPESPLVVALRARHITPGQYVIKRCDGKLRETDFNTRGKRFANSRFFDFEEDYENFFDDYVPVELFRANQTGEPLIVNPYYVGRMHYVPDTWATFDIYKSQLDEMLAAWQRPRGGKAKHAWTYRPPPAPSAVVAASARDKKRVIQRLKRQRRLAQAVRPKTAQEYWEKLRQIGWLNYVPDDTHAEMKKRLKTALRNDPRWAHLALSQAGFDSECIEITGPSNGCSYHDVLKALARDSRGVFRPTQIKDEFVKRASRSSIVVSFCVQRRAFTCTVAESDHFDMTVLQVVNQALWECGRKERFIVLPAQGQLIFLAIVPPAIFEKAEVAGLIPRNLF